MFQLDQGEATLLEYVWTDGVGVLRGKTRVVHNKVNSVEDCPEWNYDGSSTY